MRSRSTSSWILVRVCAGTPPPSATRSSTLRPASVSLRSFRYCVSARSMSMPPEASGPVFTVTSPRRIASACAAAGNAAAVAAAPAAWMNRLRVNDMRGLLEFFEKLLVGDHPAEAARHVLQPEDMQVVAIHAGDAVGEDHHAIVVVEGGERGVEHAGVGVDAHQHHVLHLEDVEQLPQVGAVEAVEPLLVVDHVVAIAVELRDDLRAGRAFDIVLAHRALAAGRETVGVGLRRVHRLPEGRGHPLAPHARYAAVYEHDVYYGNLQPTAVIEHGLGVLDDARRVLRLRRHRRDVHVEMAAVHIDGDDGRLRGFELQLPVKAADERRAVDDRDLGHAFT